VALTSLRSTELRRAFGLAAESKNLGADFAPRFFFSSPKESTALFSQRSTAPAYNPPHAVPWYNPYPGFIAQLPTNGMEIG